MCFVIICLNIISFLICIFDILKCVKCIYNFVKFYMLICKIYFEMFLYVNNYI